MVHDVMHFKLSLMVSEELLQIQRGLGVRHNGSLKGMWL